MPGQCSFRGRAEVSEASINTQLSFSLEVYFHKHADVKIVCP